MKMHKEMKNFFVVQNFSTFQMTFILSLKPDSSLPHLISAYLVECV